MPMSMISDREPPEPWTRVVGWCVAAVSIAVTAVVWVAAAAEIHHLIVLAFYQ